MTQKIHSVFAGIFLFILQIPSSAKKVSDYKLARFKVANASTFEDANKELNKYLKKFEKILEVEEVGKNEEYTRKSNEVIRLCDVIYKKWPRETLKYSSIQAFIIYRRIT